VRKKKLYKFSKNKSTTRRIKQEKEKKIYLKKKLKVEHGLKFEHYNTYIE